MQKVEAIAGVHTTDCGKREFLKQIVKEKKEHLLPYKGSKLKIPIDLEDIENADSKKINKFYSSVVSKISKKNKDATSKLLGLKNFEKLVIALKANYFLGNSTPSELNNIATSSNSYAEIAGSYIYEILSPFYVGSISVFSIIWDNLDWETFRQIYIERQKQKDEMLEKEKEDELYDELTRESSLKEKTC